MGSFDRSHSSFPMFISKSVSYSIGFCSCTEKTSIVSVGLEVTDWNKHQQSKENHSLSNLLIVSSPSRPSLQKEEKVCHIVRHLRSGCWSSIFVVNESINELPRHTNNHVVKVTESNNKYGLKCFPLGTSNPNGGLKWQPV